MAKYKYDAFVSYRHKEPGKTWVRHTLVPGLETANLKVCIDYRDFPLGSLLIPEMAKAVEKSRYTIAVVTPEYLKSNFTELENIMAQHLGAAQSQRRLILVMRKKSTLPPNLSPLFWLDMTKDSAFGERLNELVEALRRPNRV